MSYQVFARKYRPRTFDDVLGQEHVVRTLRNAIAQNRLAHAYLFVGPRGTGKTSTARIFAKALNCPGGPKVDFDPDDPLCIEIEKGIALDVREIDGASNNGVEQVRELREEVKFAPSRCRFKIYYIDEVHMLSTAAFNALLKTLEEPPEHVKFIFATTEAHKVLPTIISRCQRFDLRRIPLGVIAKHLLHIAKLEKVDLDQKAAYAIAKGAEGGMRDAQSMLDQLVAFCGERIEEQDVLDIFGFTRGEAVANLALHVLNRDTVGALQELHSQADSGKDLSRLLADLIQHFRTLLVHQVDAAAVEEDMSPELTEMFRAQAAMAQPEALLRVMDGLAEVDARMRWAANKLLHLEIGVIQAIQTLGEVTLSEVIQAIGSNGGDMPPISTARAAAPSSVRPITVPERKVSEIPSAPVQPVATVVTPPAPAPAPVVYSPVPASAPPPSPAPASVPVAAAAPVSAVSYPAPAVSDLAGLWQDFMARVRAERPLVADWLSFGLFQSVEGKVATIGLPETEAGSRESLLRQPTRKTLEGIVSEVLGRAVTLDVVLDGSLEPPPATEMSFGFGFGEESPAAAPPVAAPAPPAPAGPVIDDDFYNDPLVKAAITKFNATLVK